MNIKLKNITKIYNGVPALMLNGSVEFSPETPIICIKGESGAGKTTLLSIMAGLDKPDGGEIFINGLKVEKPKDFVRINYTPCDGGLFDALTVKDNIIFGTGLKETADVKEEISTVLGHLGILKTCDKYPSELSSGEYKRVQIAKTAFNFWNADACLIDEPTSNLDKGSSGAVRDFIRELSEMDKTKLFVIATHDEKLLKMADKILEV